jgi:hypothetical protein
MPPRRVPSQRKDTQKAASRVAGGTISHEIDRESGSEEEGDERRKKANKNLYLIMCA